MGDDGIGHAFVADIGGERARIDAVEADDAAGLQPFVEMAGRAMVRRVGDRRMDDDAAGGGSRGEIARLDVFLVGADIADMRKSEGDDLPGVGRVGEDFLIAGHGRVEADLAHGLAGRAEAEAFEHRAVGEHEPRRLQRLGPAVLLVLLPGHACFTPSRS